MARRRKAGKVVSPEEIRLSAAAALAPSAKKNRPYAIVAGSSSRFLSDVMNINVPVPTMAMKKAGIETDSSFDPKTQTYTRPSRNPTRIGEFIPQKDMIPRDELYTAMLTPSGNYTTKIAPGKAMRNGYRIVKKFKKSEPVDDGIVDYINTLTHQYQTLPNFALGMQLCEGFGQCAAFIRQIAPPGYKSEYLLDMAVIWEEQVEWDAFGRVATIHPDVYIGNELRRLTIPKGRFVMWRSERDPFGRLNDGQLQLVPAYNTLISIEGMMQSYGGIMMQRGMGLLTVTVEGADEFELQKFQQKYGNPSQYSTLWTDERMKPQVWNTVSDVLDISKAMQTYSTEFSKATSYPYQRMGGATADGRISGDATADKEAEAYSALQEKYEPYMMLTLNMLDKFTEKRGIDGLDWELDWDIEVKMDRQKRSNIFTTEATAVNQVDTILTVNEVRERTGYSAIQGPEGKMIYAEYKLKFKKMEQELQLEMQQQRMEMMPEQPSGVPENQQNKEGKPIKAQQDPAAYVKRELTKEQAASKLMKAKDNYGRWAYSLKTANDALKDIFGQGMNKESLSKLRREKDGDSAAC